MAKTTTKIKKTITFKISDIKVVHFSINNLLNNYQLPKDYPYTFEVKLTVLFNPVIKSIGIESSVLIFKDKNKKESLCNLVVFVSYEVKEFEEVVLKRDTEFVMVPEILKSFMSNNIGVTRGILYTKTQGTFLQNVYLPPVDINKFIKLSPK